MKRNIRKIAILMLIVTLLCTAVSVSAATNPPISTRSVCVYCGRGTVVTKCWGDYTYYTTGKGMHLPSSNCSVSFYKATAKEWCSSCYKVNADLGKHDCSRSILPAVAEKCGPASRIFLPAEIGCRTDL